MDIIKMIDCFVVIYFIYRILVEMEGIVANWHQICFIRRKQG